MLEIVGSVDFFSKEVGVHKIQRVPPTESRGRVHTSILNVLLLKVSEVKEVEIIESDVKISYYKDSGAGGQHRNKTMSGVRLQYQGEIVECCDERDQRRNKAIAYERLRERLEEHNQRKAKIQLQSEIEEQNWNKGSRGSCNRNYDFKCGLAHQDGKSYKLKQIMKGDLSAIYE